MTTDPLIAQLVEALRGMTPTQHSSSCMEYEGGYLVVYACRCDANVQAARAALDAADAALEKKP